MSYPGLPKVFGIANYILITGFNDLERDNDAMLNMVLQICRKANLKLYKYLCRCTSVPFWGESLLSPDVSLDPREVQALLNMLPPKSQK